MHWSLSLLDFYLKNRLLKRRIPLLASFKLTYRCNLACAPCPFHLRSGKDDSHMSWTMALGCLEELRRLGCRFVVFEGGEPLIWKSEGRDFSDLARHAGKMFLRTAVTTNGTMGLDVPVDRRPGTSAEKSASICLRSGSQKPSTNSLHVGCFLRLAVSSTHAATCRTRGRTGTTAYVTGATASRALASFVTTCSTFCRVTGSSGPRSRKVASDLSHSPRGRSRIESANMPIGRCSRRCL